MRSADLFHSYLAAVKRLTGAAAVSLMFGASRQGGFSPVMVHIGGMTPVAEMASSAAAEKLARATPLLAQETADCDHGAGLIRYVKSAAEDGHLLHIALAEVQALLEVEQGRTPIEERRKSKSEPACDAIGIFAWIGLRYGHGHLPAWLQTMQAGPEAAPQSVPLDSEAWTGWLLASGALMAWQAFEIGALEEGPSGHVLGRAALNARLKRFRVRALAEKRAFGLALVNPDDFALVNQRLGRRSGDRALREIAETLQAALRQADALFHYGSAVFAALLWLDDAAEAHAAVERLRTLLSRTPLLDGAVQLGFSAGVAVFPSGTAGSPLAVSELIVRADGALSAAKLTGGGATTVWSDQGFATPVGVLDRLTGIFTADTEKDYRNMSVLWDTVTVVSSCEETRDLAIKFVERLASTFKPLRIGLFEDNDNGKPRLLATATCTGNDPQPGKAMSTLALTREQTDLLAQVKQRRQTDRLRFSVPRQASGDPVEACFAYAVPLVAGEKLLGCLYLDGPAETLSLDSSDIMFLSALGNQIAVALDRAALAARWKREQERESRRLRQEVKGLRKALQHSRVVYRSSSMQSVLDTLRRVAPTDATVLITGESGTGKEVLARTLHEQSLRHKQPFVTVDCSAIAASLMEAELFGHRKGAYTGAEGASLGRIAQAEGGTLFLDEIGEVTLDLQAKLLRFVQEKEISPVGAAKSRNVDVRIVAATNRDLAAEVAARRFREDLFYRLQVVTVTAPPLRQRPDDILPLAHYFLEKYAVQYDKRVRELGADVEMALRNHRWPGNVRELQNRILQAVVMSDSEVLSVSDLRLGPPSSPGSVSELSGLEWRPGAEGEVPAAVPSRRHFPTAAVLTDNAAADERVRLDDPWEALRLNLLQQIETALHDPSGSVVPLGRWLTEDLVLEADAKARGVARRGSSWLGMAETTFRRQLEKAKRDKRTGMSTRTPKWASVTPLLSALLDTVNENPGRNLINQARTLLLGAVSARLAGQDALGSRLMGVTLPTYRRWLAGLRRRQDGCAGPGAGRPVAEEGELANHYHFGK